MSAAAPDGAGWQGGVRATYARMVDAGVYSARFRHSDDDRDFVSVTLAPLIENLPPGAAVLEAGCGVGDWLHLVGEILARAGHSPQRRYGFDLTPEMVSLAADVIGPELPAEHLRVGDLLSSEPYEFPDAPEFGLIYAYDVIQQLPRSLQQDGVRALYGRLGSGGTLAIFDQDAASRPGRRMEIRKAITRYLRIPLVPRFYLVARYPRAEDVASTLRDAGAEVEVVRPGESARVAIVARTPG